VEAEAVEEVAMLLLLVVQEPREETRLLDLSDLDTILQQLVAEEAALEIKLLVPPVVLSPMAPQGVEVEEMETREELTEAQEELVARARLIL
jgi:hypothetical protein